MLELVNKTPFEAALLPTLHKSGAESITVIIKGTFVIQKDRVQPAEVQQPIFGADVHYGAPETSSIKYGSDLCPLKPATDVVLVGQAYAPTAVTSVEVGLSVGPMRKLFRVFGERVWFRGTVGHQMSQPLPFTRLPLVYERAYGGWDRSDPDQAKHGFEARNPSGTGFSLGRSKEQLENLKVPNLENPAALISSPKDRPAPVGFGFVGRGWMPRAKLAGTYDDRWRKQRCPLLPDDFDEAFHNGASTGMTARPHLRGGESVKLLNLSPRKVVGYTLPAVTLSVRAVVKGISQDLLAVLDTVVIEPDDERVTLTWRAAVPCTRQFLHVERVTILARG